MILNVHDPMQKCPDFFRIIFIVRQIKGLVFHGIDLGKKDSMDYIEPALGKPESRCLLNQHTKSLQELI